ncbi:MAG: phosphoenolpyruvate synthase, partial [Polaromonas sp.]|nr:phosphoenolpyruvate synthase [Polaromonas sp.]
MTTPFIRWFSDIGIADVPQVGGKNASLGEMVRELGAQGVRVPNGFAVTAGAYRHLLDQSHAWGGLHEALDGLDVKDVDDLARRARRARDIIHGAALPDGMVGEINEAYARLRAEYGEQVTLAVRSSATAEDLPTASFAGQHETFLNISGEARLIEAIRQCFASLFMDRAIAYRVDHGIDHFKVYQSVGVMKMVRSDLAASGVTFSLDTETGFRDVVFITGADGLDVKDVDDLARRARRARDIIHGAARPDGMVGEINVASARLRADYGEQGTLAVRSSATAEDLPTASFAGQHETFLNISGEARLLEAIRQCFASLFMDRAIAYRVDHGIDHFKVYQSVGVMKMVRSDLAASGVTFSLDTETGFRDVVFITGAYGLGENVVQGTVDPDEFYVFKPTLARGHRAVLRRKLGAKQIRMVYAQAAGRETTRNMPTPPENQARFCITDDEVLELADAAVRIEAHYSRKAGQPTPMDVEWAKDGLDGKLYIVQARPETVASRKPLGQVDEYRLGDKGQPVVSGRAVGGKIVSGRARVISEVSELNQFRPGEVLVADTTMPDWGTVMKIAAAVVTNRGGRTCHAAIVAREMGIPAVVGCDHATTAIRTGDEVTVSCAEGSAGHVYAGRIPFTATRTDVAGMARPQTHLMVNLANPDMAFQTALLPNDGVGLARMEFIIAEHIHAHPMALVHPEKVEDADVRAEIARLTHLHATPAEYFVRQLAEGVGTIAAAFYPKPVIVRMSDFKTNEYASLLGGRGFEPVEANPMIGFRGAS